MTTPDLPEVGARLEKAVEQLITVRPEDDRLQLYEDAAIAMLDSEFMNYPEGQLEQYLMHYLQQLTK